jgi:hypothetical protein
VFVRVCVRRKCVRALRVYVGSMDLCISPCYTELA